MNTTITDEAREAGRKEYIVGSNSDGDTSHSGYHTQLAINAATAPLVKEIEQAQIAAREVCLQFGIDLSDSEGTSFAEFAEIAKFHITELCRELDKQTKRIEGYHANMTCGACAEGIICGSVMSSHAPDCVYTERDQLRSELAEAKEQRQAAIDSFNVCSGEMTRLGEQLSAKSAQLDRLEKVAGDFMSYSMHTQRCHFPMTECTCGLSATLQSYTAIQAGKTTPPP